MIRALSGSQCCWNCGRKASETCSGCNAARYCGSFCQHKDWERHHLICSPGLQTQPKSMPRILAKAPESGLVLSPGLEKTSSRASTPATPASSSSTPDASGHWEPWTQWKRSLTAGCDRSRTVTHFSSLWTEGRVFGIARRDSACLFGANVICFTRTNCCQCFVSVCLCVWVCL